MRNTYEKLMIVTALLIGTAFGLAVGQVKADAIPDTVLEQVTSNVYQIKHPRYSGTGTWITPTLMLTNCHVAGEDRDVLFKANSFDKTQYYHLHMVLCDKENDLGILESDTPNITFLPSTLAAEPVPFGKDVFSAGYGYGVDLSLKAGIAGLPYTKATDDYRRAMTLPTAGPGDSGSPVYNKAGQIVGILNSGIPGSGGKAFYIRLEVVRNYLSNLLSKVARAKGTGQ